MSTPDNKPDTRQDHKPDFRELFKRSLARVAELTAKLDAAESARSEPIAIIGMGCRFPGGADSPESFWHLLHAGTDAVQRTTTRWPAAPISAHPEAQRAGLLGSVDGFDADFFGMAPREAIKLDPQQRLLLEVSWEALDDAGCPPAGLAKSRTGVFIGASTADYRDHLVSGSPDLEVYDVTGSSNSFAAGRLSYSLGLTGPSLVVDTACSSSLVAVHLACQSLRSGESELALAGGVNLILSPRVMEMYLHLRALSPEGRCRTFDAGANGFVRGEGAGVIILKRLADARRDGDRIWAVVRGSAVNQDGRSSGLTAPNGLSQKALIEQALASARVSPSEITCIEAHGTGTPLGDPIEMEALLSVLGQPRADGSSCAVGSVKTNLGHLEAAAGIAGLMKVVLSLWHERIPRHLHFQTLNPHIVLRGSPFVIPTQELPWPATDTPRRAGVSSFGLSGTNAHVITEEAPREAATAPSGASRAYVLPLSARSPQALKAQAERHRAHLLSHPAHSLRDLCFTASVRRSHLPHRLAAIGTTHAELAQALAAFCEGESLVNLVHGQAAGEGRPRVVFVFPGQGSQWLGMGRTLLTEEPVFHSAMLACDQAIRNESGWSLLEALAAEEGSSRLSSIEVVQPALFAMAVALSALWRSWGVSPDAVVGHSMGEVAAAHVAGALRLEDAVRIICRRSRLLARLSGRGEMALVDLTLEQAERVLSGRESALSIAASNGMRTTVISGDPGALDTLLSELAHKGVFCRRIKVDVASHSPQVEPLKEELLRALADLHPVEATVPMRSTVTGAMLRGPELGAHYFWQNLRAPVRFAHAIRSLLGEQHGLFLEMSPHPLLVQSIEEALSEAQKEHPRPGLALPSLRRGQDERRTLLGSLAALHAHGYPVPWRRLFPEGGRVLSLPTYPFVRTKYWLDTDAEPGRDRRESPARASHPLLGSGLLLSTQAGTRVWQSALSLRSQPWLGDHRVQGEPVFPGAAYIEMALSAGTAAIGGAPALRDLELLQLLPVPKQSALTVQTVLSTEPDRLSFQIASRPEEEPEAAWRIHARGTLARQTVEAPAEPARWVPQEELPKRLSKAAAYANLAALGLDYGAAFQGIEEIHLGVSEARAHVRLPEAAGTGPFLVHPALLDACFQLVACILAEQGERAPFVPIRAGAVRWLRPLSGTVSCHVRISKGETDGHTSRTADLMVTDLEGRELLTVTELGVRRIGRSAEAAEEDRWLLAVAWERAELPAREQATGRWLLLGEEGGTAATLRDALVSRGHAALHVTPAEPRYACLEDAERARELITQTRTELSGLTGVLYFAEHDPVRSCREVLHLVQALARAGLRDVPRLWLLMRGAQPAGGKVTAPAQAVLIGLGRVIAVEHPELRCTRLDLDPAGGADIASLLAEICAEDTEEEISLRRDGRWVARLFRPGFAELAGSESERAARVRPDATYLVTGGLGGLGLTVARWLAEQGARSLVLLGRRGAETPEQQAAVRAMIDAGLTVKVVRADVAELEPLREALQEAMSDLPPLRGVLHAAGVLSDGMLVREQAARIPTVLAPKVHGAWNLHQLTKDRELDFFILYSSAAVLLGSPGQGSYAAANAFLDALASYRQGLGLPALSVAWGAFSEVGLAAAQDHRGARLASRGLHSMEPLRGTRILSRLLASGRSHLGVVPLDIRQWLDFYPTAASSRFLSRLLSERSAGTRLHGNSTLLAALNEAGPAERKRLLGTFLAEQAGRVLRIPLDQIDPERPLTSLGLDSLMGLELRNRIEAGLGKPLSAALLFTHPNLSALASHLAGESPRAEPTDGAQEQVDAMTEDDLARFIAREFEESQ